MERFCQAIVISETDLESSGLMSYKEVYDWGTEELRQAQIAEAELDARLLLEHVCGTDRNTLLAHGEREVTAQEKESYVNLISERRKHMPLQYLTGVQDFMGLEFSVNTNVLIPRQDTEILVEEVMRHLHDGMRILDMCTGSGCILLSLLYYSNDCTGLGVDISENALQTARRNAEKIGAKKAEEEKKELHADFMQSDLFEKMNPELFDIIVSNPPYIRQDVIETLMPEVRDYEPLLALDGREDGLYFYRAILQQTGNYLTCGGMLFFEIGYDQGQAVKELMKAAGYAEVEVIQDFAGLDRVVWGIRV